MNKTQSPNPLAAKVQDWAYGFLHSPASYDGKTASDIIKAEIQEAQTIFKRELPKRKASATMQTVRTQDGLELAYWFISKAQNTKVKILLHGSGGNFAKADRAVALLDRGFNIAMISYRGHSGNPGKADQRSIINDVTATIQAIMLDYPMQEIYLEGSSLGTSILAHSLKRIYQDAPTGEQFASLLLKAAPLNLKDRDQDTINSLKAAGIDANRAQPLLNKLWNQEDAYSKIRAAEIIIVHGSLDDVVPVEHASKIKDILARNNSNITLRIIDGEGHQLNLNQYGVW
ncbi:MAG: prolyl oligopeptidase family serine peptidase [Cyanobacteria bacterium]|nr:prolyl oligopeptidase family serine peptidase [Cyanobacteriota bacterium]MDA1021008.1 prolyl oligopeptidase family serine peptidase [Cyanobacteriota bacterium]